MSLEGIGDPVVPPLRKDVVISVLCDLVEKCDFDLFFLWSTALLAHCELPQFWWARYWVGRGRQGVLASLGTHVSQRRMPPHPVVKHFDVLEHALTRHPRVSHTAPDAPTSAEPGSPTHSSDARPTTSPPPSANTSPQ